MRNLLFFALCCFTTLVKAQVSPWGTGQVNNIKLDTLAGPGTYVSHTTVNFFADNALNNHTYNIYIPPSYNGTEAYGLITFINSGDVGTIFNSWKPVLDEKKIIFIAGNNIGNAVNIFTRMDVALAGTEKLKEILNIDTTRLYTSGNSGGARTSTVLSFFFPEIYTGAVPNCGAAYLRQVTQDYETHQPNSHYEYALFDFFPSELDYVNAFNRRYALMTSFDDFREGDIMNIYHNGMVPDGFKSKILETEGGHCSTTTEHFQDAINFIEHPYRVVVNDSFNVSAVGHGFKQVATAQVGQQLVFRHDTANIARAYGNDVFVWNNPQGAILKTQLRLNATNYNQNTFFNIGLLDFSNPNIYNQNVGHRLSTSLPNLLLSVVFNGPQPTIHLMAQNPIKGVLNDTLFTGLLTDWAPNDSLPITCHIWASEIRIEFGKHFNPVATTKANVKLLDDKRSVRVRTNNQYWDNNTYTQGTLLTFVSGKIDTLAPSSTVKLDFVELIVADTLPPIVTGMATQSQAQPIEFNVFPNPARGKVTIDLGQYLKDVTLKVFDVNGKCWQSVSYRHQKILEVKLPQVAGLYLLRIEHAQGSGSKLIVNKGLIN